MVTRINIVTKISMLIRISKVTITNMVITNMVIRISIILMHIVVTSTTQIKLAPFSDLLEEEVDEVLLKLVVLTYATVVVSQDIGPTVARIDSKLLLMLFLMMTCHLTNLHL